MSSHVGDLTVTEQQRERSLAYLQHAFAQGRITKDDLDRRVEIVLQARTRVQMNVAFEGLAHVPLTSTTTMPFPSGNGVPVTGRLAAGTAHFSALATGPVGPAVVYGLSTPGSFAKREAAKAFNFQLVALVAAFLAHLVLGGWVEGLVVSVGVIGWLVLTLTGGARAMAGEDWRNPVSSRVPVKFLAEGRPRVNALDSAWGAR